MEIEKRKSKGGKMNAIDYRNNPDWAENMIGYLCDFLHINETVLAGYLNVTKRTVDNWKTKQISEINTGKNKGKRLEKLHEIVQFAIGEELTPMQVMNMLNEPLTSLMEDEDDDPVTLLYFIAFEPENKLLGGQVRTMIKKYKDGK